MQRRSTVLVVLLGAVACAKSLPPAANAALPEREASAANVAPATPHLALAPDAWIKHVEQTLMPFWMQPSAYGRAPTDPFPTNRCRDGKAWGEPSCNLTAGDFKTLLDANAAVRKNGRADGTRGDGPYEWLTGPRGELLDRTYIRMHSRQTYAYGVAFHLTGKTEYLALAHRGVQWLLEHAIDKEHGSYTFVVGGKPGPEPDYRTSQDQSYTLMGIAFYYYLTRDPGVLAVLNDLKDKVKTQYMSADWEQGRLIRWMRKTRQEPKPTCFSTIPAPDKGTVEQKELVGLLDQVNAYMLMTTLSAPAAARGPWLDDLHSMAQTIWDRFYNDGQKSQDQAQPGVDPVVPSYSLESATAVTESGRGLMTPLVLLTKVTV